MKPPPVFPSDSVYTSCYCEENVYLLCLQFLKDPSVAAFWEIYVVFISNENKTAALWYQMSAREEGNPVVWDYHVILLLRPREPDVNGYKSLPAVKTSHTNSSWVYDFDTTLPVPCRWEEYLSSTFPEDLLPAYESKFRVVPGLLFSKYFASDRSHMIVKATALHGDLDVPTVYIAPPPVYAPICGELALGEGITNNLMAHYVSMNEVGNDNYGVVLERDEAKDFFAVE